MNELILIVDDEVTIRDLLARFLMSKGCRTTALARASDALTAIQAEPPDLIICDLQLEDSDGLDLIGQLKQSAPQIPIVLLTGVYFDPEVARSLTNQNVACYLQKTTPLEGIWGSVRRLLRP